jgi:putative hydrolase of the HAD superfamily
MEAEHDRLPRVDGESCRYTDRWFRAYVPAVFRSLGAPAETLGGITEELLARFRREALLRLFPETLETLDRLRARGIRLAVVSNWSPRLLGHLERLGLSSRIDAALVSAVEGVEKPDPALFARALARLGVGAREAVHVGDHPVKDVAGAASAGIRPILLDRAGAGAPRGVEAIRSLRELDDLLGDPS